MTVGMIESKIVFKELIEDVNKQEKRFPKLTGYEIAKRFFSEKHEIALRFNRFHEEVMLGGFSQWRNKGYMDEDFEILMEYAERGCAQRINGFHDFLSILELIGEAGNPENFYVVRWEHVTCSDCGGTGGTYVEGKCSVCDGRGSVQQEIQIKGKGEEQYLTFLDSLNEKYYKISKPLILECFEEFINRMDEEDVNVEEYVIQREKKNSFKPPCKLLGENGNTLNLMGIVRRTLRNNGMIEEVDEMQERIFAAESYEEALSIFSEYVDVY